jgi:glycosyltransferase involved in cell wall biosynthesis
MAKSAIRVCHVASGDLWAGAEAQVAALLEDLSSFADLNVSAVVLNDGKLSRTLASKDIPVVVLDESSLSSARLLKALYAHFKRLRPDIVHTHRYKENILAGVAAKFASVPVVIQTVHGLQERLPRWRQLRMDAYASMNRAVTRWMGESVIAVSAEIAEVMKRALPLNHVVYVPNGIDTAKVKPSTDAAVKRKELGLPAESVIIGTVCRLVPVKRIEFLLEAFDRLRQELPHILLRLVVVGDGPMRPALEEQARRLKIDQQTLFVGERHDVYDLINCSDIYALSSLHEGIPMALLEAMALGRPVVASRVGGITEILSDGEAKLVAVDDVAGFKEALKELVMSPRLRARLGDACRERIGRGHGNKNSAVQVRELYRTLTGVPLEITPRFSVLDENKSAQPGLK